MEEFNRLVFHSWLNNMKYQELKKNYGVTLNGLNSIVDEGLEQYRADVMDKYGAAIDLYQSGVPIKSFIDKIDISKDKFEKILKFFQKENKLSKTDKRMIYDQISNGIDANSIAESYRVSKNVISDLVLDFHVDLFINAKIPETRKAYSYKDMIERGCFSIVKDAYVCGKKADDLKRIYNLSESSCYYITMDHNISTGKIDNLGDLYIYKHFLSEAYDNNIITDDMLNCLFHLDRESVESLNVHYDGGMQSYLSSKLYQIYLMPSLLNDFHFLSHNMKQNAQNFINRRYGEELLGLKKSHASSWKFDNLREMYYGSKGNKHLEKVLQIK